MYVNYYDDDQTDVSITQEVGYEYYYEITQTSKGPFGYDYIKLKKFLDKVDRFDFVFSLQHEINSKSKMPSDCYEWKITQNYKYSLHGVINVSLDTDRLGCGSQSSNCLSSKYNEEIYLAELICRYSGWAQSD